MKYRRQVCFLFCLLLLPLTSHSPAGRVTSKAPKTTTHDEKLPELFYKQPASGVKRLQKTRKTGSSRSFPVSAIEVAKQSDLTSLPTPSGKTTKQQAKKDLRRRCEEQGITWRHVTSKTIPSSCPSPWLWNLKQMVGGAFSKSGNRHHSVEMAFEEYDNSPWLNLIARIAFQSVGLAYGICESELAKAWLEYELIEHNQSNKFSIQDWLDSGDSITAELTAFRAIELLTTETIHTIYHFIWSPPPDYSSNIGRYLTGRKQPSSFGSMAIWDFMKELEQSVIPHLPGMSTNESDKLMTICYKRILRCIFCYDHFGISSETDSVSSSGDSISHDEGFSEIEDGMFKQNPSDLKGLPSSPYMHIAVQIWLQHLLERYNVNPVPEIHPWLLEDSLASDQH